MIYVSTTAERGKSNLARPPKWRRIEFIPDIQHFVPFDAKRGGYEENILKIEEAEAIRLKDLERLDQEECAARMEISRQTFQRILHNARRKVADSLVNGKAIRIEGGYFTRNICLVRCLGCGREWEERYENYEKIKSGEFSCPVCGSKKVACLNAGRHKFCRRSCWRRRGS